MRDPTMDDFTLAQLSNIAYVYRTFLVLGVPPRSIRARDFPARRRVHVIIPSPLIVPGIIIASSQFLSLFFACT